MSMKFTNSEGITLINPGSYVTMSVKSGQTNSASSGVVTVIGEADEGPAWTAETNLDDVVFAPDSFDQVVSKFGSGRLVDAFKALVSASSDPAIQGAVSQVRMVKTNPSVKASLVLSRSGFGDYATLSARREGRPGNTIKFGSLASVIESAPVISDKAYVPHYGSTLSFGMRTNGSAVSSVSITAKMAGPDFVTAMTDYTKGILVTGGTRSLPLTGLGGGTITLTAVQVSASVLTVSLPAASIFDGSPTVGDVVVIPLSGEYGTAHDSVIKGAADGNCGAFIISAVTNTSSSAVMTLKLINGGGTLANMSGFVNAAVDDIVLYKPVTIANKSSQLRGSLVGMVGTFTCSSNDGVNVVLEAPTATTWTYQPQVGDILTVPATVAGITAGFYQVSASTTNTVSFYRLSNGTAGTTGTLVVATPIVAGSEPFAFGKPVIDGVGKSLEIVGTVSSILKNKLTWLDAGLSNSLTLSTAEYVNAFTITKGILADTFVVGGGIIMNIGCTQDNATVVIGATSAVFKVAGTTIFTANYSDFATLNDFADLINAQSTFSASVVSSRYGYWSPSVLDYGTFGISGVSGNVAGRIKADASLWELAVNGGSSASVALTATAGLPEVISGYQFLLNGAKGSTTSAQAVAAVDACEDLTTNFIVPLFSADASVDVAAGLTESSSTYTVDAINAYVKGHVISMSTTKMRKNRVAIVSKLDTYANIKIAAGQLTSYRVGMCFQDINNVGVSGSIVEFQPWMAALIAAGMQAAAGYKGIVKKFANVAGAIVANGDFNPGRPSQLEDALLAGLLVLEKVPTGGWRWVSDQMTYSVDSNFVYNSLQAVYVADLMALTLVERFDSLVVGKSVAEVSAAVGMSILETEMFNFLRLKWIAPSDDAPKGFKNASIKLSGGVMLVTVEVKLAGLIYFVPISFTISQVEQTA